MATINMHDAKTQLSDLVARAEAGEEIVIARRNKPAVKLVRVDEGMNELAGFGEDKQTGYDASALRDAVAAGKAFTIMEDGKPVAKVVPTAKKKPRTPGGLKGMFTLPDSFFDPLPEEELQAWEGKFSHDADA